MQRVPRPSPPSVEIAPFGANVDLPEMRVYGDALRVAEWTAPLGGRVESHGGRQCGLSDRWQSLIYPMAMAMGMVTVMMWPTCH